MTNIATAPAKRKQNRANPKDWPNLPSEYLPLLAELSRRKVTLWPYAGDKTICEPEAAVRLGVAPYELGFLVDDHDGGSPQPVAELLEDARAWYDSWPSATKGHLHRWIYCGSGAPRGLWRQSYRLHGSFGELRFLAPTIVYDPVRLLALMRQGPKQVDLTEIMKHFALDPRPYEWIGPRLMKGSDDTLNRFAYSCAMKGMDMSVVRAMGVDHGVQPHVVEATIAAVENAVANLQRSSWDAVQNVTVHVTRKSAVNKQKALLAAVVAYEKTSGRDVCTASRDSIWRFANQLEPMSFDSAKKHLDSMLKDGVLMHLGYVNFGTVRGMKGFKRKLSQLVVAELTHLHKGG